MKRIILLLLLIRATVFGQDTIRWVGGDGSAIKTMVKIDTLYYCVVTDEKVFKERVANGLYRIILVPRKDRKPFYSISIPTNKRDANGNVIWKTYTVEY